MIDWHWSIGYKPIKDGETKMDDYRLGAVESRFAELIWANEPIASGELVRICETELEWKKSTTYTVLKKLCNRGIFRNYSGIVTSVISRDELYSRQSEQFVSETFGGSLPQFIAAFTRDRKLSDAEVSELTELIRKASSDNKVT